MEYIIKFFRDKAKLFYVRKILIAAVISYLLFGFVYRTNSVVKDPMGLDQRLLAAGVFLILYILSYTVEKVKENIYQYFYYAVYFANFHLLYLAYQNKMSLNYAYSIIIVITICNLLIKAQGQLTRFNLIMIIAVSFVTLYTRNPVVNKLVFLIVFYIITLAAFTISKLSYLNIKNIQDKKSYYKKLFEKSPIGLVKCDREGNILDVNNYILQLTNKESIEYFLDKNIFDIIEVDKLDMEDVIKEKNYELKVKFPNISAFWVDCSIEKLANNDKSEYILAFKDITNKKELEKRLTFLSFHDQMTGLYNYRYFMKELERYNKSRELPISILVIDIDELKIINDTKGHLEGNKIIKKTAGLLKESVRGEDILARIGGDEFAVILPNTDSKTAKEIGKRINKKINELNKERKEDLKISLSIGWSTKTDSDMNLKDILNKADLKMYNIKDLR